LNREFMPGTSTRLPSENDYIFRCFPEFAKNLDGEAACLRIKIKVYGLFASGKNRRKRRAAPAGKEKERFIAKAIQKKGSPFNYMSVAFGS